jgi:hypothetical protein
MRVVSGDPVAVLDDIMQADVAVLDGATARFLAGVPGDRSSPTRC